MTLKYEGLINCRVQLLYSLLTGLAGWGLSDTTEHGDAVGSHYRNCDDEAQGKPHARKREGSCCRKHLIIQPITDSM